MAASDIVEAPTSPRNSERIRVSNDKSFDWSWVLSIAARWSINYNKAPFSTQLTDIPSSWDGQRLRGINALHKSSMFLSFSPWRGSFMESLWAAESSKLSFTDGKHWSSIRSSIIKFATRGKTLSKLLSTLLCFTCSETLATSNEPSPEIYVNLR